MTKTGYITTLWQRTFTILSAFFLAVSAQTATISWTGLTGDGNWSNPNNWNLFRIPINGDDVVISDLLNTSLVNVPATVTINSLSCNEPLRITGSLTVSSSVNLTKDVDIDGGTFTLSLGGTLNTLTIRNNSTFNIGNTRTVTLSGLFTWTRGTISGTGAVLNSNGGGTFSSTATGGRVISSNMTWNMGGTNTWSGNNFTNSSNTTVNLISGATLNATASAAVFSMGTFNNSGTINRNNGTGIINFAMVFNNNNRVNVNAGTAFLSGGGTHSGRFDVANNSILRTCGVHSFNNLSIVQGAGTAHFDCSSQAVSGTYNITGATQVTDAAVNFNLSASNVGALTVNGGGTATFNANPTTIGFITLSSGAINFTSFAKTLNGINMSGGTLTSTANINLGNNSTWSGGSITGSGNLTVNAAVTLTINGASQKTASAGRTFINNGTVNWSGTGNVNTPGGATNTNVFNASSSGSSGQGEWSGSFTNTGSFIGNDGRNVFLSTFNNNNACTLSSGGDLQLLNGGNHTGQFNLTSTGLTSTTQARVTLQGTHLFQPTSSVSNVSGQSFVNFGNGTATINGFFSMPRTQFVGATCVASFNTNATLGSISIFSGASIGGTGNLTGTNIFWAKGAIGGSGTMSVGDILWTVSTDGNGNPVDDGVKRITGTRSINVSTAIDWSRGEVILDAGAQLTLAGAGVMSLTFTTNHTMSGGTFVLNGTMNHTTSTAQLSIGSIFNNQGVVNIQTGNLRLSGAGTHTGRFSISANRTLQFDGSTHNFQAASRTEGAGIVEVKTGTVNVSGLFTHTDNTRILFGSTLNFNTNQTLSSNLFVEGTQGGTATLTCNGIVRWAIGNFVGSGTTIANNQLIMMVGPGQIQDTRRLENRGTYTWGLAADINCAPNAQFVNAVGGIVNITSTPNFNGGTFNNLGTLNYNVLNGTTNFNGAFNNSGSVNVSGGRMNLDGTGTHTGNFTLTGNSTMEFKTGTHALNGGTISVGSSARLVLGGTMTQAAASFITNNGITEFMGNFTSASSNISSTGNVSFFGTVILNNHVTLGGNSISLGGDIGGAGTLRLNGSSMNWGGGLMSGVGTTIVEEGRILNVSNNNAHQIRDSRILSVRGELRWTGGLISLLTNAQIKVPFPGVFDIRINNSMTGDGLFTIEGGTLKKSAGIGITTIDPRFINAGSLLVEVSNLLFTNTARQTAGTSRIKAMTQFDQPYIIEEGAIQGTDRIQGNVVMQGGSLEPGNSPGMLTIQGNLTLQSDSLYLAEIGGTDASQIDKVIVHTNSNSGTASLAGTLEVLFTNGYVPQLGDSYRVMEYDQRIGQFDGIALPSLPEGLWIVPRYAFNAMFLDVALDRIPGDVDGDGCVNDEDLLAVLFAFGQSGGSLPPDLNEDGTVNDEDLLLVLFNFGNGC